MSSAGESSIGDETDVLAKPLTDKGCRYCQHLAHAGTAYRPLAANDDDIARIDTAMEAINAAWQAASQEMYAAGGAEGGQPGAGGFPGADGQPQGGNGQGQPAGDHVTDVDYEEVDGK